MVTVYFDYLLDDFNSTLTIAKIASMMDEQNKAITAVGQSITGTSDYDKVEEIHDYIVNKVTYDKQSSEHLYSFDAYGVLADNYNTDGTTSAGNMVVCEGYARAFRALCKEKGLNAITVRGYSGAESNGHMWNDVRMGNGLWYPVDCTWDDTNSSREYMLCGADIIYKAHTELGAFKSTAGTLIGDYEFIYPTLSSSAYGIELDKSTLSLTEGSTGSITVSYISGKEPGQNVTWTSSNTAVATVAGSGTNNVTAVVTAVAPGSATITVTCGVYTTTCIVTVIIPVQGITLSRTSLSLISGDTSSLLSVSSYSPSDTTERTVTWTSSNTGVITVTGSGPKRDASLRRESGTAVVTETGVLSADPVSLRQLRQSRHPPAAAAAAVVEAAVAEAAEAPPVSVLPVRLLPERDPEAPGLPEPGFRIPSAGNSSRQEVRILRVPGL